jgi:hypothetical protein
MRKVPLTIWTILAISAITLLVTKNDSLLDTTKIDTISKIITVIGVYYVALQINKQSKDSIISTEYINQPNFEFMGSFKDELKESSPDYCTISKSINYNQCIDLHWFDFKQIGNLPAKNVKLILVHKTESNDILNHLMNRKVEYEMVYPNNKHQFKLKPHSVPISLFNAESNGEFFILLDYISIYSKIRYKRVYSLDYAPKVSPNSVVIDWPEAIRYFGLSLCKLQDSRNIGGKNYLKNKWYRYLYLCGIKKTESIDEWIINI